MQFETNLVVIHVFAGIQFAKSCFLITPFSVICVAYDNFLWVLEEFFPGAATQTSPL